MLMRLVSGFQVSQAISVAATLGIADLLGDGPRSADELAVTTGSHPGAFTGCSGLSLGLGVFPRRCGRPFHADPARRLPAL